VTEKPMDAEKALRDAHEAVCEAPDYAIWPRCEGWHGTCEGAHEAITALARAAFEAGRTFGRDDRGLDPPLPKWLTETSR